MSKQEHLRLKFYGGAQIVTGVNYLLEHVSRSGETARLLIDCGLFQGSREIEKKNHESFHYSPSEIDAVFVTHSHLDHIGRIPKLIKDGFKKRIYSTPPTKELAKIMLEDSLGLLEKENRRRGEGPLYQESDVKHAIEIWEGIEYHQTIKVGPFSVMLKEAGHILGSAMVEVVFKDELAKNPKQIKFLFSGDLGNPPNPILRDAEKARDIDYLVIESAYGDRIHDRTKDTAVKLERVMENAVRKKSVLMIPAFSLERTQKLLFDINNLVENGRVPKVPIFLDSPLAIAATKIYKKNKNYYNENAQKILSVDSDLFNFPGLKITQTADESKSINDVPSPKIIIAGSGMSTGGRIVHHERRYLPDPNNIILFISYQSAGSLGRQIFDKAEKVNIYGENIPVRASVEEIGGYSAHADMDELSNMVRETADAVKKVFIVQGELKASSFLCQQLRDYLGVDAVVPEIGQEFEIKI